MNTSDVVYGLAVAIIAATPAYLLHQRSKKVDAATARAGAATDSRADRQQVLDELNAIIDDLRIDKKDARTDARDLAAEARQFAADLRACHRKVLRYVKLYGDINGNEGDPHDR